MNFLVQIFILAFICHFTLQAEEGKPLLATQKAQKALPFNRSTLERVEPKESDPILSAECEPLRTVGDCVNIVSGHFFQVEKDLASNSIEPLDLIRFYDSGSNNESAIGFGYGLQFPIWASEIFEGSRYHHALISEREGFFIPYKSLKKDNLYSKKVCCIDPKMMEKGYTNLSRASLSGNANFVNWRATYRANNEGQKGFWSVRMGDGSERIYANKTKVTQDQANRLRLPSKAAYLLTKEIKANGNQIHYSYKTTNGVLYLSEVAAFNRTGKTLLDKLTFKYYSDGCRVTNASGLTVDYSKVRNGLTEVDSSQKGKSTFKALRELGYPQVLKINKPRGGFLAIEYDEASLYRSDDKVHKIYEPRGPKNESVAVYRFHYDKKFTSVWDAHNQRKDYHFDKNERLTSIDYRSEKGIVRQDAFEWSFKKGHEGWLKNKSVKLGKNIYYLRSLEYDEKGNITRETLYGNLTGEKNGTFTLEEKANQDRYSTHYRYSDDVYNLLVEKKSSDGLTIAYVYLPKTNLCRKEFHIYQGKIQERIFREYDENGQLASLIEDDGCGQDPADLTDVTYRRIKSIKAVTTAKAASYGKPEQETLSYLDLATGQIVLMKRTEFSYDSRGNEKTKKIYNSQNVLCFKSSKQHDQRNLLVKERDPAGRITLYEYDESGNKTKETLLNSGKTTFYTYDKVNRLTSKKEAFDNGESFVTTYSYNALDQLVYEIDPYGHKTSYHYDRLGREVSISKPYVKDAHTSRTARPRITKEYNLLDQMTKYTDENGFTTSYSYNLYGNPTKIIHPDGAIEKCTYYPKGWLKQKWLADGTSFTYLYDAKGRLIQQNTLGVDGAVLKEESFVYKGALLQHKKDAMGILTTYRYDGAGRKIEEVVDSLKIKRYLYDDFGRLVKVTLGSGSQEEQSEIYGYDALDRLISKELQDSEGRLYSKESYAYDLNGQKIQRSVWQSKERICHDRAHYNADGTLDYEENGLGERISWKFNHHHLNEFGQQVECRERSDPLGRLTRQANDALHRLVREDLVFADQRLSCSHFDYDLVGHLIKKRVQRRCNGDHLSNYTLQWEYDSRGRKIAEIELPANKITLFTYDQSGRLVKRLKPDGVSIHYRYDGLGRLIEKKSSDNSIAYSYEYDLHDNLIAIFDSVHQTNQKRTFDPLDRLIQEEISPGVSLSYSYDRLDRVTRITLSDGSFILYHYDPVHLKKIERYLDEGELAYACDCEEYDLRGQLLKKSFPGGKVDYTYDLLGRTKGIDSAHWQSEIERYDAAGNLLEMKQKDPQGLLEGSFSYDPFDHLKSEKMVEENHFTYDSLGNCLEKNGVKQEVNSLNQLVSDGSLDYKYDLNGNLIEESLPPTLYTYDALNRLVKIERDGRQTTLLYDSFDRVIEINDALGTKQLVYQGMREIGSFSNGKLEEFRLFHPHAKSEQTFALEVKKKPYFPIQDHRYTISALQTLKGSLAQWYRYSSFQLKSVHGEDSETLFNPWRFSNRREIEGLSLFTHRLYHPKLRRWMTPDPIGFEDGLNLYAYIHNNPHRYIDPDGLYAFLVPVTVTIVRVSFALAIEAITISILPAVETTVIAALTAYGIHKGIEAINAEVNGDEKEESEEDAGPKRPYCGKELGEDSTKCPGEGFEWRGKGDPASGNGSWVKLNEEGKITDRLHPDFNHPPPMKPHWDYKGNQSPDVRLNTDGTWEWK